MREQLGKILPPNLSAPHATATHEALLTLGRNREGRYRLITTNFDRLFEEVIAQRTLRLQTFQAPLVPVPKNRWDGLVYLGLVYLHGLLEATPTCSSLDRLVVSSGDFGLAYLIERWAARFVSELYTAGEGVGVEYRVHQADRSWLGGRTVDALRARTLYP